MKFMHISDNVEAENFCRGCGTLGDLNAATKLQHEKQPWLSVNVFQTVNKTDAAGKITSMAMCRQCFNTVDESGKNDDGYDVFLVSDIDEGEVAAAVKLLTDLSVSLMASIAVKSDACHKAN